MGGEVDFNANTNSGQVHDGWRVAGATLAGERQMVAGSGSGGVDRIGGSGADRLLATYRELCIDHPVTRDHSGVLTSDQHSWRHTRPRRLIGKVHQGRHLQAAKAIARRRALCDQGHDRSSQQERWRPPVSRSSTTCNAMNNAMRDEFAQAWTELNEDPSVRVIVHTGEGRDFQTGVDVGELATDGMGMER